MYYNYHARNLERIKNGEFIDFEVCDKGEFALILHFNTKPYTRPIREHSLWRYENIIERLRGEF